MTRVAYIKQVEWFKMYIEDDTLTEGEVRDLCLSADAEDDWEETGIIALSVQRIEQEP